MSPSFAIQTQGLRKEFGEKVAVANLTLTVERGEVFGFLGPNGAGKTTAVKMLLGLIRPTSGEASLLGAPLNDQQVRGRVGFLPEHFRFHDWLTASEFLALHADLYRMPAQRRSQRIPELLELVGLAPHAAKRLRQFSKGMLQRIGLAQALLNEPELVILDEPTSGLDPVGRRLVRDIIRDFAPGRHDRLSELAPAQRGGDYLRSSCFYQVWRGSPNQPASVAPGRGDQRRSARPWIAGRRSYKVWRVGAITCVLTGNISA